MNWQHCADMAFVGLSDSYEQFYQATRRCWRFGQKNEVNVHIIIGSQERNVLSNIKRKQAQLEKLQEGMVQYTKNIVTEHLHKTERRVVEYRADHSRGNGWQMYLGDCIDILPKIESDTIHYSIFSPPFSSLYTYSDSERDLGNSKNDNEFFAHLSFLIKELYRVTIPGRLLSFHCMNLPTSKQCHGHIGLRDFRGNLIRAFEGAGWIYHSEVVIWKDPVTAMQRTKALGLLWKQIKKDSSMCRQGVPDYLVTMRKPGENKERVIHTAEGFPVERWQRYASPVWMDINQSNTLQRTSAREHKDERHICPLQLEVIQRALELWTNPGDTVLSPFAGIGSEGYQSILAGRRFIGVELKQSYYNQAMRNLARAETSIPYPLFEEENESVSGEELMELDA
jgi:DNA modification methylase